MVSRLSEAKGRSGYGIHMVADYRRLSLCRTGLNRRGSRICRSIRGGTEEAFSTEAGFEPAADAGHKGICRDRIKFTRRGKVKAAVAEARFETAAEASLKLRRSRV